MPLVTWGLMRDHSVFWPASESRYMMTVPLAAACSTGKSVEPGTHPSAFACSQLLPAPPSRSPMMTFSPLSRAFIACPRPCVPYPSIASVSFLNIVASFALGKSERSYTTSGVPPKSIVRIERRAWRGGG